MAAQAFSTGLTQQQTEEYYAAKLRVDKQRKMHEQQQFANKQALQAAMASHHADVQQSQVAAQKKAADMAHLQHCVALGMGIATNLTLWWAADSPVQPDYVCPVNNIRFTQTPTPVWQKPATK